MRIGRYRKPINEALSQPSTGDRSLRSLLFLASLYHDIAKPMAKQVDDEGQIRFWDHDKQGADMASTRARILALSNDEIQRLETVIRNHMRILFHTNRLLRENKPPSRRAVYRFFRDTGTSGMLVCLLAMADLWATYEQTLPQETWAACLEVVRIFLENWFERPSESIVPPPLVDGNDIMKELGMQSGRQVGDLLEAIREAQAMGAILTREQALDFARRKKT
jgi:hypothetical protein